MADRRRPVAVDGSLPDRPRGHGTLETVDDELTPHIRPDDLTPGSVILDVREDDEWRTGHIEGAVHVPIGSVPNRMAYEPGELLSDDPIVVTCKGGGRAGRVVAWLNTNGFDAVVLDGGMLGWEATGKPMVSESGSAPHVL